MASLNDVPDIATLQTWEQAFDSPIPVVRILEKKLQGGIEENKERLRGVVGSSYRELLGTARSIVDIDEQTKKIEQALAEAADRCDPKVLERVHRNHEELKSRLRDKADTLRNRGSHLFASKLLVLARVLHKALSDTPDAPPFVEKLGGKLASMRQKLLRHIDRRLLNAKAEVDDLAGEMAAFSLATSSSPTDVLKHFQGLRLRAVRHSNPSLAAARDRQYLKDCMS
ncbi:hypothetical protein MRB53_037140 [Persea americana]|nr:hypothetical protein MRB53_037140 [Persea americana]